MVNLIGKLHALIKPGGDILDTDWLAKLPRHDYLAAQDIVLERLQVFATPDSPLDKAALQALLRIDAHCRQNVEALIGQYIRAPVLAVEVDERLWHSIHDYYQALDAAYQAFLDHHAGNLAASAIADAVPQILLNLIDTLRSAAKWRYLRYQAMAQNGWLRLHDLYRLAERMDCTLTPLQRYPGQAETTVMCCYVQALMLDTLNHTSMLKPEIEMVADWIAQWCRCVELEASYSEPRHLFFVNLDEDRGGRRLRHFRPAASQRYWDTDKLVMQVDRLSHYLHQDQLPDELPLAAGVDFADCRLLSEHLLGEWSRHYYRRQRRNEERDEVRKDALVVHGLMNACQHIKNVFYGRRWEPQYEDLLSRPLPAAARLASKEKSGEVVLAGSGVAQWVIHNESQHGFGAIVHAGMNLWLRPGKLVVLDYEMNPDMPVLGVVRSVQQQPDDRRSVGVEVICHTPAYVRMRSLAQGTQAREFLPADIFLAMALTIQGQPPFPALYLPHDENRDMPATLVLPRAEFVADGVFEMRTDSHHGQVKLGRVIEQRDDWVRVEAVLDGKHAEH